ncbi:unnamed protein product [Durusdinium trenchii]|uniref:JmjC domain-containing protein n=1 Tax=Durusdinium trenchii TaxID=1381693 RepID=A0ABP0M634_9DINO
MAMVIFLWLDEVLSNLGAESFWLYPAVCVGFLSLSVWIVDCIHAGSSRYLAKRRPEVLPGFARLWPCCSWTPTSFADCRDLLVNVSHGVEETGQTVKSQMQMHEFVDLLNSIDEHLGQLKGQPQGATAAAPATPYLKQLDLDVAMPSEGFAHSKRLESLDSGLRWWGTRVQTNFWMGSSGCLTGLHTDDEDNFLVQCHGTKRVCLFPPECAKNLYVNAKYDSGTLCCDVDAFNPDYERHPLFHRVKSWEVVELNPGDVLFIPAFWWHSVLTTSRTSISLNSFVSRPSERLTRGVWRQLVQ